jgi:mRNA interferase RelE/StbE
MASYSISLVSSAAKQLRNLDPDIRRRVTERIDDLAKAPFSHGAIQLQGNYDPPLYRVRVGAYRIVYIVDFARSAVVVHGIAPRDKIYDQF